MAKYLSKHVFLHQTRLINRFTILGAECGYEVYSDDDIEAFAAVFFNSAEAGEKLQPILDQVVVRWNYKQDEERKAFRSMLQAYIRLYGFVSQLIAFADSDLEKLYVFARHLNRKLPKRKVELPYHVRDAVDLDSFRLQQTFEIPP